MVANASRHDRLLTRKRGVGVRLNGGSRSRKSRSYMGSVLGNGGNGAHKPGSEPPRAGDRAGALKKPLLTNSRGATPDADPGPNLRAVFFRLELSPCRVFYRDHTGASCATACARRCGSFWR